VSQQSRTFRRGTSPAFLTADGAVSADRVLASARALAAHLPDQGYAVNLCEDRLNFAIGFVASVLAGRVLLLPQNRKPATLGSLAARYPGCFALVDPGGESASALPSVPVAVLGEDAGSVAPPAVPDDGQLCALVFTSGSTGEPQPNRKTWRTLLQGTLVNERYLWRDVGPGATILATVPSQHMYGLETTILAPLFLPLGAVTAPAFFPADIVAALRAMPRPRILVSTPIHLRALLSSGLPLPEVDLVLCATAPLDPGLARQVEAACGGVLREVYGCTEAGCFAWREPAREEHWRLFEEFALQASPDTTVLAAGHLPEQVVLQDRLGMSADGRFTLLGRLTDLVNIAGKRASLADLNIKLLSVPGVVDGVIVQPVQEGATTVERLTGLVVSDREAAAVQRDLAGLIDPVFLPRPLIRVAQIPRGPSGKIDRAGVQDLLRGSRRGGAVRR